MQIIPNNSPSDILNIQARAPEYEALLRRQGQAARIMKAIKCPCASRGHADLHCVICNGYGYTFDFQVDITVIDENSPHFGVLEIFPLGVPISNARAVQRTLHSSQGGNINYTIDSFTDTKIVISGGQAPKRYERVRVTYDYNIEETIENENSEHLVAGYTLHTTGTKITFSNTANPFNIHGDITSVTRVYNVTQDISYSVLRFNKQSIILDDESGAKPQVEITDVLQVDYTYVKPAQVGTGRMIINSYINKTLDDVKESDTGGIIPGGYQIGRGDLVTFLTPRIRDTAVIKRGSGSLKDEIPQFDVAEIIGEILDEDGIKYVNDGTKFSIQEYNDLVWISGQGPAAGKKYSVTYIYNPTYRIYKQNIDGMNNENKYFPNLVQLRFMNRFDKKDFLKF